MVSFAIPVAFVLSMHTFVMGCGWPISYNVFHRIMTSLPVTKHIPVSDSEAEAATNFKILQFTCIGPFKLSRVYFEGILPKKTFPVAQLGASVSVRYCALVLARKNLS